MSGAEPATTVSIASGPLVGPILRRVVGMLAARADLPLDRLDDAVLVADLIAARAPAHSVDDKINVALDPGDRSLVLRVGPLRSGGGQALAHGAHRIGRLAEVMDQQRGALLATLRGPRAALRVRLQLEWRAILDDLWMQHGADRPVGGRDLRLYLRHVGAEVGLRRRHLEVGRGVAGLEFAPRRAGREEQREAACAQRAHQAFPGQGRHR